MSTLSLTGQSFGFGYDDLSRRTSLTRNNTMNTSYSYDPVSRLLSVLHKVGATTKDGATYIYDSAGNRTSRTDNRTSTTLTYTYDDIYQLKTAKQGTTTKESYTYDAVGNRLSSLGVSPYSYNTSNQLTSLPGTTYTYDNNGNTATKVVSGATTSYTWDYENRLTQVTLPGTGGTVTFKYDPFGRRVQKSFTVSGTTTTTNYVYDGANVLEEVNNAGTLQARYTHSSGIDEPLAEKRGTTVSYYEADGLGSVTSLSNTSGALANTYTYDAYGKLTASTGTVVNPFRFTGREFDSETGVYFFRARYLDGQTGRFISEDPARFSGGPNFYSYAGNTPTNRTDPFGLKALSAEQCRELREVLELENEYGTFIASLLANITFNSDGILHDFNSQNSDYEPVQSARGPINLDWFSTLEATTAGYSMPAYARYGIEKSGWIIIRHLFPNAPEVTNNIPYSAPDERNAAWQVSLWRGYKDLFPPDWMDKNCNQECKLKNKK